MSSDRNLARAWWIAVTSYLLGSVEPGTQSGPRRRSPGKLVTITILFAVLMAILWIGQVTVGSAGVTTLTDVVFTSAGTNDPPGSIDPGYTKDVGSCTSQVVNGGDEVDIVVTNGFPSYTCTFTVTAENTGSLAIKLDSLQFDVPPVLTVKEIGDHTGLVLQGGEGDTETFTVHVEQPSFQQHEYVFTITKPFTQPTPSPAITPVPLGFTSTPAATRVPHGVPPTGGQIQTSSDATGLFVLLAGAFAIAAGCGWVIWRNGRRPDAS
jgi:hypothetical protein